MASDLGDARLVHYSCKPLPELRSVQQDDVPGDKPRGLWLSVIDAEGDGWRDWCEAERFGLSTLQCCTEIILCSQNTVLSLDGIDAFDAFHERFSQHTKYGPTINWMAVANTYDGIVIAPYLWQRRYEPRWYYGWDCASGCIWNPRSIKSTMPITAVLDAAERAKEEGDD